MQEAEKERDRLETALVNPMKEFIQQFLAGGYGVLMGNLQKMLAPGLEISRLSREDFINFLEVAGLCTGFVRLKEVISTFQRSKSPFFCQGNRKIIRGVKYLHQFCGHHCRAILHCVSYEAYLFHNGFCIFVDIGHMI